MASGLPSQSWIPQRSQRLSFSRAASRRRFRCVRFTRLPLTRYSPKGRLAAARPVPPADRVHEGLSSEAELLLALGDRVTLVVETLDRGPVIAPVAARVDRVTEPPLVVAHG